MKEKTVALLLFLICYDNGTFGQSEEQFKPYGKPVFLIYSNAHYSINNEGSKPAFEIARLYLGYEHFFNKSFSARGVLDVGDPGTGGLQMTAYVKNAFLMYKTANFSARFGMIGTDAFGLIEKQWGHRYILKPLQDEYGLNPSADIGAGVEYTPSKLISFDASILNGEGYKRVQADSVFKYTAGISFRPADGLLFRAYTDLMKKDVLQNTLSFYAGYTNEKLNFGVEYAVQRNNKMIRNHDFSGISATGALKLSERFGLFARYDYLWSATIGNDINPWNYNTDGQLIVAGFEYSPVAGIRIAPVYFGRIPANPGKPFTSSPGIYFEIKL
jgi:hypothetical protein